jgi:AraC family transcriptional regulator
MEGIKSKGWMPLNSLAQPQIAEYVSRINKVMDYLDNHLEESLDVETLARIANFSPYHFHRIFSAMLGETLFAFIGRLRMEKAARLMCGAPDATVTEVALSCGFSSPAAFSRAFKEYSGLSPSEWKKNKSNTGKAQSSLYQALRNSGNAHPSRLSYDEVVKEIHFRRDHMKTLQGEVAVKQLEETTVAYVRYIGPYAGDEKLFERLFAKIYAWTDARGLVKSDSKSIVIYHDDPAITQPENLRTSVGFIVPADTEVSGEIGKLVIPKGKYAMGRFLVNGSGFGDAWEYMCGVWLPQSGYQPDEGYTFELYEDESKTPGQFDVTICIPVKPM